MEKKNFGQFYTTNYKYILKDIHIPISLSETIIIEPFAGKGDLIDFIKSYGYDKIECYDIDPKKDFIIKRDTLKFPLDYKNKYVITNPPYLARNKSKDKSLFDKYSVNDLYKCFIKQLIDSECIGGILIVPLNFWCSIRSSDIQLRKSFLEKYNIIRLNIFEESVFEDTTYAVCSFQFEIKHTDSNIIKTFVYPNNLNFTFELNDSNNYMFGGEIYNLNVKNQYKISRLVDKIDKNKKSSNILIKCIDDTKDSKIGMSYIENKDIDKYVSSSSRAYAILVIEPNLIKEKQLELIDKFNEFLTNYRKKYHSLFLTNYRESSSIARKRISFDLVYLITEHILDYSI
jgi:hypothetical protein